MEADATAVTSTNLYDPLVLALYPVVVVLTGIAALFAVWAVWKARNEKMSLWFVLIGLVLTKMGLTAENAMVIFHRVDQLESLHLLRFDVPIIPLMAIKISYIFGTSLQVWGVAMALFSFRNQRLRLCGATYIVAIAAAVYAACLWYFWNTSGA